MAHSYCKARVECTLSYLRGVDSVEVGLTHHTVAVTYDEESMRPASMKRTVDEASYEFQV